MKLKLFFQNQRIKILASFNSFVINLKDSESLLRYGLYLVMIGLFFYSFALITNSFTIPLSGDYVLQQIPFYFNGYDDWWNFFKTGEFPLWDSSTYLGANAIGSNSFYYYLNPFFLPILIFPRFLVPQGLAILMIAKNVMAGFAFRAYVKYLGVSEKTSRLFGLAYAFCGWITYYLWFNHFMEVAVLFPLMLLGIEKLLKTKRPWFLCLALFLMGITNYFFLISSTMAGVLYALYRYFLLMGKRTWSDRVQIALWGIFAFAVGLMMSAVVFLPSVYIALTSNRVSESYYLPQLMTYIDAKMWKEAWDYILIWHGRYGDVSEYDRLYPLISFLFPTVSNRSSTLLNTGGYDNTISSLFIFTPMMLFLVPSLINSIRKRKYSHFIALGFFLFALFTPFFYGLFHGFTVDYGRWQIFVVASMMGYIAVNYDQRSQFKKWYFDVSFVIMMALTVFTFFEAKSFENQFNFKAMLERAYVGYAQMAYLVVVYVFLRTQGRREMLTRYLMWFVAIEAAVMGTLTMNMHSLIDYETRYDSGINIVNDEQAIVNKIKADDSSFYRIYNLNAGESSNIGMRLGYNGMTAFHSLYNFKVMEFNEWSHMNYNHGGWSMGYHEKRYNLDLFLNVKYYIVKNIYDSYAWTTDELGNRTFLYQNVPTGFVRSEEYTTDAHTVYINTNFIEGGFSYDNLINTNYNVDTGYSDFYRNYTSEVIGNEEAYLTGAILKNEDVSEVATLAPNLSVGNIPFRNAQIESANVRLVTCDENFEPANVGLTDGCTVRNILSNNPIIGYQAHRSAVYVEPNGKATFGAPDEDYFYALQLRLSHHATVYLFDENDDIIVRDAHSLVSSSFKYMRGYYSPVPVKRIVIIPKLVTDFVMYYPTLFSEPYSGYETRRNELLQYPLENMEHTSNTIDFSTNYDQKRFIVLSTPFDDGWKVRIAKNDGSYVEPKVYKAQGGFVGYLSEEGPVQHHVYYITPQLPEGMLISLGGFLLFGGTYAAAYFVGKKKEEKEQQKALENIKPEIV